VKDLGLVSSPSFVSISQSCEPCNLPKHEAQGTCLWSSYSYPWSCLSFWKFDVQLVDGSFFLSSVMMLDEVRAKTYHAVAGRRYLIGNFFSSLPSWFIFFTLPQSLLSPHVLWKIFGHSTAMLRKYIAFLNKMFSRCSVWSQHATAFCHIVLQNIPAGESLALWGSKKMKEDESGWRRMKWCVLVCTEFRRLIQPNARIPAEVPPEHSNSLCVMPFSFGSSLAWPKSAS
jgi:hypothetical protein